MNAFRRLLAARGRIDDSGADPAGDDATDWADSEGMTGHASATAFLDTIHLPQGGGEGADEPIVRPSLAIPFRMAVGPGADYYAPRCLEYERTGRSFPTWNWAPLLAPGVWAIYRRLWLPGIAFVAWPLLALALFRWVEPDLGESGTVSLAAALLLLWLLPGCVGALVANTLVYRQARRLVMEAEARTPRPEKVAKWLSRRAVIAPVPAALAGAATIVLALFVVVPSLQSAYTDQVVRSRIAESLAAIAPLQRRLEAWFASRSPSRAPVFDMADAPPGIEFVEAVNVSPINGRVRLALGPLIPELSGRSILLAPAIDRRQHVRWICIPVDIPARYLPQECRQG